MDAFSANKRAVVLQDQDPPRFVIEYLEGSERVAVELWAQWWDGSDYSWERVDTALRRFAEARDLPHWLEWFDFRLLSIRREDAGAQDLPATTAAIFAFLRRHPRGVSFSQFIEARHAVTKHRITESEDSRSIAAMLRRHSQNLSAIGYGIRVSLKANRIELVKRNPHQ